MNKHFNMSAEEFIEKNKNLAHSVARKFKNTHLEYDEIYNIALIGMFNAYENFDPSLGFKFSSYAIPVMKGSIQRAIRDSGGNGVHFSREIREIYYQICNYQLYKKNPEYILLELKKVMPKYDLNVKKIRHALNCVENYNVDSVYSEVRDASGDNSKITLLDTVKNYDDKTEMYVEDILSRLNKTDRGIFEMFMNGYNQSEIGRKYNISQSLVSRKLIKIKEKLRNIVKLGDVY